MNSDTMNLIGQALETVEEEGGRLMISKMDDGSWVVGMEWGREAEDSDMAGAAAYGLQPNLYDALDQALGEVGLNNGRKEEKKE
jgi:hypothetical protein